MKTTKTTIIKIIPALFFLLLFFGLGLPEAHALTISPARIEINGNPGTTVAREITLFNDNKGAEETYYVSYSNFEAQGETGSPLFVEPTGDLGTWISADKTVTLPPGGSKTILININIPTDAYAGGHFAVIFFGTNPNREGEGQVSVGAKTGTLILLSVNGDVLEAGGLVSFNTKEHKIFYNSLPVDFEYRWKNDGNDRVKPEGKVTIHDAFYIPADRINANAVSGNILPHSTRLFNLTWIKHPADPKALPPSSFFSAFFSRVSYQWQNFAVGPYFAKLNLTYGSQNLHSTKTAFFFVFPWQLLICIFLVLLVVFFIVRKLLKRYNRYIINQARHGINNSAGGV